MPGGSLLVYTNRVEPAGGEYSLVGLPDLTVTPYAPLNSDEWFVDWTYVLSPDMRHVAYERSVDHDYASHSLFLLDLQTGESTQILGRYRSDSGGPTWTSDSRFLEFDNGSQGFYVYDTVTGGLRHVAVQSEMSGSSSISPSGDRIAFEGTCPENISCPVDLYLVNSDGTSERFLEKGDLYWIFWSADGRMIYYSLYGDRETYGHSGHLADGGYRLYAFDLESGQSHSIEDPRFNTSAYGPGFLSPDGNLLAYNFREAGLKVRRTSDGEEIGLLPPGGPAWSPDSRYLAASTWEGDWYLFDAQTGDLVPLDLGLEYSTIVGWLP